MSAIPNKANLTYFSKFAKIVASAWCNSFVCMGGAIAQWPEHLQLKQEILGSIPRRLPWIFFSSSWLTSVDGMKDLWCSSTVWLLSTQI